MKQRLLDTVVCPSCLNPLKLSNNEFICDKENLAFPVNEGIPVLLIERARKIEQE